MTDISPQFITHATPALSAEAGALLALAGGCRWVQLRMKDAAPGDVAAAARRLLPHCRAAGARLIIDDHADVALAVGADGVHLGRDDMPVDEARRRLGPAFIIGGTANTLDDIRRLCRAGADYIGCGPYRFTTTKRRLAPLLGLEGYRALIAAMRREGLRTPVVAIGGIGRDDIPALLATGVDGIALSGSVLRAADPAEEMRQVVRCCAKEQ